MFTIFKHTLAVFAVIAVAAAPSAAYAGVELTRYPQPLRNRLLPRASPQPSIRVPRSAPEPATAQLEARAGSRYNTTPAP